MKLLQSPPGFTQVPTPEELDSILQNKPLSLVVYFLDDTFEELTYDPSTTIAEARAEAPTSPPCAPRIASPS